ncbi:hypothetical protein [Sinimarinibacterium flocculans]|uniref:Cytochrome c domain-containing protein n=1 Tax=Sinimarinibacterium flocculans TaxID=985250 RepID=A0A318ENZ2_9GAMM|nr:hypothetical protein [Sinimarinibacterium flocculans]PXV71226.1 hypothetical protein C8D93_101271 [Sinimarinibacterium flocculans]
MFALRPPTLPLMLMLACAPAVAAPGLHDAPGLLSETGLYADIARREVAADVIPFSPQYPLWSDGASKRRWIRLPAGTAIDASNPDAWVFPIGTRLWKQFAVGRAIETRMIDRIEDGSWRFVSYVWREDGTDAELAPVRGMRVATQDGDYRIPSQADCRVCHEGAAVPVLGFSALQLSADRDPLAPHAETPDPVATDLDALMRSGRLTGLPADKAPRIDAPTPVTRAALGYLHANCGHCHDNAQDAGVPTGLLLAQRVADPAHNDAVLASLVAPADRYRPQNLAADTRLQVLAQRMATRDPRAQMPPLGTAHVDTEGLALIQRWLDESSPTAQGGMP